MNFVVTKFGEKKTKTFGTRAEAEMEGHKLGLYRVQNGNMVGVPGVKIEVVPPEASSVKKGVPLPVGGRDAPSLVFHDLEVGDSFFVSLGQDKPSTRHVLYKQYQYLVQRKRNQGEQYATRLLREAREVFPDETGPGIGIWRTK